MLRNLARRYFRSSSRALAEIEVFIDGNAYKVDSTYTIMQACNKAGVTIPHFCYHDRLAVAGSCRMCLVEVEKNPKPVASCAMHVAPGMRILTNSEKTYIARGGVMEFLLANHPLDCPICDQGGECDLQDQSMVYGYREGRFLEYKRAVEDKEFGPLISTIMTRCIHCTRCVRFAQEIAGTPVLGTTGRGKATEISTYISRTITSELSGNLVDLCPVGALTNAPYAFTARPWELRYVRSFDVLDALGPAITINARGPEVMRVLPRVHDELNEEWIHDRTRHAFDGLKRQRLAAPMRRKADGSYEEVLWNDALILLGQKMNSLSGDEMAGIIGENMDLEAITAFRDLFYKLGCENIESRRHSPATNADFRGNYLMNSKITGVEECDLLLFVGCNPRLENPVLNARVRKMQTNYGLKVGLVGSVDYITYEFEHLGNSTKTLEDILSGNHHFSKDLDNAKLPMIIVGSHALQREDGEGILKLLLDISDKYKVINPESNWNGFNVLNKNVGSIGAFELGISSNFDAKAKPKLVFLLGSDNFRPEEIPDDAFVVYLGTHGDEGAARADLILPGAAYTEKSATYVNIDGRVLSGRVVVSPPGQARVDWEVIRALSEVLGVPLPYDNLQEIRFRIAELAPHLIKYDWVEPYSFNIVRETLKDKVNHSVLSDYIDVRFI